MLEIEIIRGEEGWLANQAFWTSPPDFPELIAMIDPIERRAGMTSRTGRHSIWEGYRAVPDYRNSLGDLRSSDQIRTSDSMCLIFAWLAAARRAGAVIEIGAAFGISGMYWLSGLKLTGGQLYTFEPNTVWADLARGNLSAISDRYTLIEGPFENHAAPALEGVAANIGVIDAIHTSEAVFSQLAILKRFLAPGALIVFVGVNFSPDMRECWRAIRDDPYFTVSAKIGPRVGLVELPLEA